jgi:hypothetical protein
LAIRKLDSVVMPARMLGVHLPKARDPSAGIPFPEETEEGATPLDITIKRKFGTRQEADRNCRLVDGCEAARGRS